jgi:hypothetical protein
MYNQNECTSSVIVSLPGCAPSLSISTALANDRYFGVRRFGTSACDAHLVLAGTKGKEAIVGAAAVVVAGVFLGMFRPVGALWPILGALLISVRAGILIEGGSGSRSQLGTIICVVILEVDYIVGSAARRLCAI